MKSVRWGEGWQAVELSPWWLDCNAAPAPNQDYQWQAVQVTGQAHARSLIGDAGDHVASLRAALEAGSTNLSRFNDSQILEHVAALLADGAYVLQRKVLTAEAAMMPVQIGPAPKKVAAGQANDASVKSVIKAAFAMPQRAAAVAAEAAPAPVSDFESVDQDLQAAALVQAAVDGVPFCEVCEKAKREREAAQKAEA
jgi:hypothetical protein